MKCRDRLQPKITAAGINSFSAWWKTGPRSPHHRAATCEIHRWSNQSIALILSSIFNIFSAVYFLRKAGIPAKKKGKIKLFKKKTWTQRQSLQCEGSGYLHDCSPTHGLGSTKRGGESQRITTRREHEVDPARLVLTEEQGGGEQEQQRQAGGSGLHPGWLGQLAAPGLNCVVDEEAQRQSQENMGVT